MGRRWFSEPFFAISDDSPSIVAYVTTTFFRNSSVIHNQDQIAACNILLCTEWKDRNALSVCQGVSSSVNLSQQTSGGAC